MSPPGVVFGTGQIGAASDPMAKQHTPEAAQEILNVFRKHGFNVLDTARSYSPHANWTCEPLLGQTDFAEWAVMNTKYPPTGKTPQTKENVADSINESLKALKVDQVNYITCHVLRPELAPFPGMCEAVNEAYKAGKVKKYGLSNGTPAQVEEIHKLCQENGWLVPTLYQGSYNPADRKDEAEMIPLLRRLGMVYQAYR